MWCSALPTFGPSSGFSTNTGESMLSRVMDTTRRLVVAPVSAYAPMDACLSMALPIARYGLRTLPVPASLMNL